MSQPSKPNQAKLEEAMSFLQAFKYFYEINEATAQFFIKNTYPLTLNKGETLHKSGDICNHIYFIVKGAIRGFVKDGNKEKITWISVENEMTTSIYRYYMQKPNVENMDAVEDCQILSMIHEKLHQLHELGSSTNILVWRTSGITHFS